MAHRLEDLLTGVAVGSHCDACTHPIPNGGQVYAYAVRYPGESWRLRRVGCPGCLNSDLSPVPGEPEQAIVSAISWRNQLAAVTVVATTSDDSEVVLGED
ncbi:MAG: hypothetical protein R3324_07645 [Halobacteriales archaeon]|nr:hypothetical protein [Halobacteriales archaeon]